MDLWPQVFLEEDDGHKVRSTKILWQDYRNDPKYLDRQAWVNSVEPEQTAPERVTDCHSVCILYRKTTPLFKILDNTPGPCYNTFRYNTVLDQC